MKNTPQIFPVEGLKKGGTYGARVTRKAAGHGHNASSASLNNNNSLLRSRGAAHNPRPGNYHKRFATDAERQMERRVRNVMNGLTTQGKPRQRHENYVNAQLAREARLQRNKDRSARIARTNKAAGLRSDGKPFRRHSLSRQWQYLRSAIRVPLVSFEDVFVSRVKGIYQ